MGIFGSIKNAIFGNDKTEKQPPATSTAPATTPATDTFNNSGVEFEPTTTVDVAERLDKIEGSDKLDRRSPQIAQHRSELREPQAAGGRTGP